MFVEQCQAQGKLIALAESCTGGLLASAITSVPGASQMFKFGWVCYSSEAKDVQLGVSFDTIEQYGVVSEPVAVAMAEGALIRSHADYALALTGNAGPTAEVGKASVGTVCLALASKQKECMSLTINLSGLERNQWRERIAMESLDFLLAQVSAR